MLGKEKRSQIWIISSALLFAILATYTIIELLKLFAATQ